MKHLLPAVVGALLFLTGCAQSSPLYENDDLVSIAHNEVTDYTLLIYRSTEGTTRKVLRRKGVCELMLIETKKGEFWLKERGEDTRKLNETMVSAVKAQLQELVFNTAAKPQLSGTELTL